MEFKKKLPYILMANELFEKFCYSFNLFLIHAGLRRQSKMA
jgi:hypothetical protein